jgi:hypothetical protein
MKYSNAQYLQIEFITRVERAAFTNLGCEVLALDFLVALNSTVRFKRRQGFSLLTDGTGGI